MKYYFYFSLVMCLVSCTSKINSSRHSIAGNYGKRDSVENVNYNLLQEYAICRCIYNVPENKGSEGLDISPSVYANILNYRGTDTLAVLAKEEALKIKPEKYVDYQNKKATFARCSQWAKSKGIDTLVRMFAKTAADEWMKREGSEKEE